MRPLATSILAALAFSLGPLVAAAPSSAQAQAFSHQQFAAISIDAASGQVLFAHEPDTVRYPASLTKLMTLYIVFDEMAAGRVKLSDHVVISPRAAAQSPTKLGLRAGETISVEDAIAAVAIRSANDIAVALAEHVSGSETRFAARMTQQALALGMRDTVFRNASGLPHQGQISTARDMAVLGRALLRDHASHYGVFGRTSFTHRGRTIAGHNRITQHYPGADGLKTGYIRSSGFNLISSAVRNDKRVIAVVLGGPTGAARDAYMQNLLSSSFTVLAGQARGETLDVAQFLSLPRLTGGELPGPSQSTAQGATGQGGS